ncbi:MAG: T9SS type A sorting domain-containing protein, partial [Bacteroidota bacterium]
KFYESGITPEVTLSESTTICASNFRSPVFRHAGSTVMTFDEDNDGDKEVLLGDVSFSNLVKLTNGGDANLAFITGQDASFPSNDVAAEINIFPAGYYLDVNNDGQSDLIAAPNSKNGENYEVAWWYENVSATAVPDFEFQQRDFLVEEMIDLGSAAHPVFVDYNADGLQDMVVGSGGFFLPGGQRDARLFLYENTGSATAPAFTLVDDNYLNFKQFSDLFNTFAPCFGDLDNDNDMDLLVGEFNGSLFFAENTAGPGEPFSFGSIQANYMNIDVGQASKPQIMDMNKDGLADLVIGERNGNVNYLQNIGSTGNPMFNPILTDSPNKDLFGGIDERGGNIVTGFSSPQLIATEDDFLLVLGTEDNGLSIYSDIAGNLDGTFVKEETDWGNVRVGERIHPALADLTGNGRFELLLGNNRGGLNGFRTNLSTDGTVPVRNAEPQASIKVFPNPATDQVFVQSDRRIREVQLFDITGKLLQRLSPNSTQTELRVSNLQQGVYVVMVDSAEGRSVQRIVVQ